MMTVYKIDICLLTDKSFFFFAGGDELSTDLLLFWMGDVAGELEPLVSSSSDSKSSRRRLRLLFPSTFGDSQFDSEFGSIFDTWVRTYPIIDCKAKTKC